MTIITLWKQGKSKREIARLLGHDRQTIRKIIKGYEEQGIETPARMVRSSIVEAFKDQIIQYLEQGLSGVRIHEELLKQNFKGKYRTICDYIHKLKANKNICVRFHTLPGEEAQVDFGYVGMLIDTFGKKRKAYVFSMRLSYSRLDYFEVVFDQKVETFISCHINAFTYFGGVPQTVKIDNLKAAVLEAHFYEPVYQTLYKEFSEHYQFNVIACRVAKPQEKGKIESGIKYVKNNFFAGRKFDSNKALTRDLHLWLETKCNSRIHGTTRKVPRELFEQEERKMLACLPAISFLFPSVAKRKVCKDCHITLDYNYYSVPHEYVGKMVDIQRDHKFVKILHDGKQIALHPKSDSKGVFITNDAHYPKYKLFTPESPEYRMAYRQKMQQVGGHAAELFVLILQDQPHSWYRTTKGILSLSKLYSNKVLDLACKRALSFNISSYSKIKNICQSGSYALEALQ